MNAISSQDAARLFDQTTGGSYATPPNNNEAKALELLGKGVRPSVVAVILGVTPAVISQYQEKPEFKELLQAKLIESQMAASVRDARLDALEDKIITSVERSIDFFVKPEAALGALKLINGLQRRTTVNPVAPSDVETRTVVLNLPQHMHNSVVNIQVSSSNEVVEVNGREMRTMPTGQVLKELEVMQETNTLNLERENEYRKQHASKQPEQIEHRTEALPNES